MSFMVMFNIKS